LKHPNGAGQSDSKIAAHVGVSDKTVAKYRQQLEATSEIPKSTARAGADGRTITTANIGKSSAAAGQKHFDSIIPEYEAGAGQDDSPEFTAAVATITNTLGEDVKVRILSGNSGLSQEEVVEVANLPAAELAEELGITRRWSAEAEEVLQDAINKRNEFYGDLADVRPAAMLAKIKAEMAADACPECGGTVWATDNIEPGEFCKACKRPRDAAPDQEEQKPVKPVVACPKCGASGENFVVQEGGRFVGAMCLACEAGDTTRLIVDTQPDQPAVHLSDLLLSTQDVLRKLLAKCPPQLREAIGRRLVAAGEEIIETGDIR
jgi:hypothetical protein